MDYNWSINFPIKIQTFQFVECFRRCEISTSILAFFWYRYLWVRPIYGCTVTLVDWQHETMKKWHLHCMTAIGMRFRLKCKNILSLWLLICRDPFNIMALALRFWIWKHFARWLKCIFHLRNFKDVNNLSVNQLNFIFFCCCFFSVDSSCFFLLHAF